MGLSRGEMETSFLLMLEIREVCEKINCFKDPSERKLERSLEDHAVQAPRLTDGKVEVQRRDQLCSVTQKVSARVREQPKPS